MDRNQRFRHQYLKIHRDTHIVKLSLTARTSWSTCRKGSMPLAYVNSACLLEGRKA